MSDPNVLLIVMDTARAQNAFNPEITPNLHAIAEEGTSFTKAFSTAPWTLPSHASMFTGQYTSDHNTQAGTKQFNPDVPTLAELLYKEGYQTVGVSNNTWVSSDFGFDRGFAEFFVGWELLSGGADLPTIAKSHDSTVSQIRAVGRELLSTDAPQTLVNAVYAQFLRKRYDDGARVTNWRIRRWFSKQWNKSRPFFMFVNYLEPHLKYDPPDGFIDKFLPEEMDRSFVEDINQDAWSYMCGQVEMNERDFRALSALYNGELAYLDHRIGQMVDRLDKLGVLDETVLIIIGDHGENIGEHGLMDHQYSLYDTLLHVPLIIRYPKAFDKGSKKGELVELRDIYPTILDLTGVKQPDNETASEHSLLDEKVRDHIIGEYITPQPSMEALRKRVENVPEEVRRYDRGLRCMRTAEWKYIEGTDGSEELYNINVDPEETTNVANDHPRVCAAFAEQLTAKRGELFRVDRDELTTEMDATTEQRLEDLGYLQ